MIQNVCLMTKHKRSLIKLTRSSVLIIWYVISGRRITVDHYREGVMVKRLMEDSSVTENELQEYKKDSVFINLQINKLKCICFRNLLR